MRAYIIGDMVGSCGVWRKRQCQVGSREWRQARRAFTQDVNAAIEGFQRAGFTEIVVKDIHGVGTNLFRRTLLPRVRYQPGFHLGPVPVLGEMQGAHCAILIGAHARAGSEEGFFPHTFQDHVVEVRVNGTPVGESELMAALLGDLGIPVCFLSGDATTVSQVKHNLPWLESLVVPKDLQSTLGATVGAGTLLRKRNELRSLVEQASTNRSRLHKYLLSGPVRFEMAFRTPSEARFHNTWGLRQWDHFLAWEAQNFTEAFRQFIRVLYVPRPLLGVAEYLFQFTNFVNRNLYNV